MISFFIGGTGLDISQERTCRRWRRADSGIPLWPRTWHLIFFPDIDSLYVYVLDLD